MGIVGGLGVQILALAGLWCAEQAPKKKKKLPFTFGAVKKQLSDLMCLLLITGVFNGLVKRKRSFPLGTVNLKNTFYISIITIIILYNDRSRAA